jgi:DNA-binding NarL/FixJ family response regulator
MAEGKSNHGTAQALIVSQAAAEKHITSIFHKLELDPAQTEHRRVLAVLAYLRDPPNG